MVSWFRYSSPAGWLCSYAGFAGMGLRSLRGLPASSRLGYIPGRGFPPDKLRSPPLFPAIRGLGVPHDAEPIVEGVEADDAVIPDPEFLPVAGEVDVLGGEAQESGIGMDGFLPLDGAAPEGAGPVVDSAGDPDAQAMGAALAFPPHDGLQVVHLLEDPDQGFRLHQVEGNGAGDVLPLGDDPLGDDPLGDIPDDGSLDQAGLGPVPVQVLLGQAEVAGVLRQG